MGVTMPYVEWKQMTPAQRQEAVKLRPNWHPLDFKNFAFWIKADTHVSRRGGHHELTEGAYQAILDRYTKPDRSSSSDLSDWKLGTTFHFAPEKLK